MQTTLSAARKDAGPHGDAQHILMPAGSTLQEIAHAVTLADHLRLLQECSSHRIYSRNEAIFNEGDPADQVYQILGGTVRLCRHMPDGRRYIEDFMLPGDLVGFTVATRHQVTAEAVTTVSLTSYPRSRFDSLGENDPHVRADLLAHISTGLAIAQKHLFVLSCQNAKERFASFVLRMADRADALAGDSLDLSMGRQDIADHLGLTIETICRAIALLKSDGAIALPNSRQLVVKNVGMLRAISEGTLPA
jgi:CRP-like cAMP-binding protein